MADSDESVVNLLLTNSSCKINILDNNSRTALHWAALLGKTIVCGLLLDHHAKYDCPDTSGAKPLHYAVEGGHVETVEVLMRRPEVKN